MSLQEQNIAFVGEVEKHEVLYNYSFPGHSRKDITDKAWQEVATKVNLPAAECKERWRNLRTVFIRKIKRSLEGPGKRKRSAYYLTDAMQFCVPFILPRTSSGSWQSSHNHSTSNATETNGGPSSPGGSSDDQELSSRCRPVVSMVVNDSEEDEDQSLGEHVELKRPKLESTSNKGAAVSQNADKMEALKMFLLSLLPELAELNDSQIKLFKRSVFNVIDDLS